MGQAMTVIPCPPTNAAPTFSNMSKNRRNMIARNRQNLRLAAGRPIVIKDSRLKLDSKRVRITNAIATIPTTSSTMMAAICQVAALAPGLSMPPATTPSMVNASAGMAATAKGTPMSPA